MPYYIGRVVINDHESRREYSADALFAAKDDAGAKVLLNEHAAGWDDDGERDGSGYRYDKEAPYTVTPYDLVATISAATFRELAATTPSFTEKGFVVEAAEVAAASPTSVGGKQYFIGRLEVLQEEYESHLDFCIAAPDEAAALDLLAKAADELWGGAEGTDENGYRDYVQAPTVATKPERVIAVSFKTFLEMAALHTVLGKAGTTDLAAEPEDERVKTLARRIGDHLKRWNAKVSHSKLLHAISASLGETDWQVLLHKQPTLPTGELRFSARNARLVSLPELGERYVEGFEKDGFVTVTLPELNRLRRMAIFDDRDPAAERLTPEADAVAPAIPGVGFLYRVLVSVDTSMSAVVLVRGETKEVAIENARRFAADGLASFEVDEGNYRGFSDYYCADDSDEGVYRGEEPAQASPVDIEGGGVQCGPYLVKLSDLGETDDELLWGDLEVFDMNLGESDGESGLSSCPVSATEEERQVFCRRIAVMMQRGAPDASKVDNITLRSVFYAAMQGENDEATYRALEERLRKSVRS